MEQLQFLYLGLVMLRSLFLLCKLGLQFCHLLLLVLHLCLQFLFTHLPRGEEKNQNVFAMPQGTRAVLNPTTTKNLGMASPS